MQCDSSSGGDVCTLETGLAQRGHFAKTLRFQVIFTHTHTPLHLITVLPQMILPQLQGCRKS